MFHNRFNPFGTVLDLSGDPPIPVNTGAWSLA